MYVTKRNEIRWQRYQLISSRQSLLRSQYDGEGDGSLCARIFWAFITVQYVELSGLYTHFDRIHFLTSVYRLLFTPDNSNKPNQTFIRFALGEADKLLAVTSGSWARKVIEQENEEQTK
jgi:hypothetical protein